MKRNKFLYVGISTIILGFLLILFTGYQMEQVNKKIKTPPTQPIDRIISVKPNKKYVEGEKIGTIIFSSLKEYIPIYEGTTSSVLAKGAGHYSESALPGERENHVIISGHRDTYFKSLKLLNEKDLISVETSKGTFTYRIKKFSIVSADNDTILTPRSKPILTLTTCYPFSFIGNAPKRFIVTAELTNDTTGITKNVSP
ncbi:class D sortase [Bacillus sp. B1-b2]|uniref:class D sortase n=1 Tax=Bacillus sp. B1-b2 TaxID=2653201 RepID=UPI001261E7DA|nr:class D sortase [Bacillus sp. B1-b2]KAB7671093.1 class D sortase [Bacillus sp. B1-b2]